MYRHGPAPASFTRAKARAGPEPSAVGCQQAPWGTFWGARGQRGCTMPPSPHPPASLPSPQAAFWQSFSPSPPHTPRHLACRNQAEIPLNPTFGGWGCQQPHVGAGSQPHAPWTCAEALAEPLARLPPPAGPRGAELWRDGAQLPGNSLSGTSSGTARPAGASWPGSLLATCSGTGRAGAATH